jgi:pyruvate dehydrogenase (quinone)
VIAIAGDGAMQMNGINALITAAKYYQRWSDARLVVVVLNNRDLNQVTWEQRAMAGDPKYSASQDVPDFFYADYAEQLGLGGVRVTEPGAVDAAIESAFAADRPFVLEFVTDPDVPPLPPHISFQQAAAYFSALLSGDPDARGVVRRSFANLFPSLARKVEE